MQDKCYIQIANFPGIGIVSLFYVSACVEFIFACSFIAGNDLVKVVVTSLLNIVPDLSALH